MTFNNRTNTNIKYNACFCGPFFKWMKIKELVGFKGDQSALPEADLFMLMLVKIPK